MFFPFFNTVLEEIERRAPTYLSRFPVALPSILTSAQRSLNYPSLKGFTENDVRMCLEQAVRHLTLRGVVFTRQTGEVDPVGEVLFATLMDGLAAMRGNLALPAAPIFPEVLKTILSERYDLRSQPDDVGRAYFRRQGQHPVVLINAIGIPLTIWGRFLQDDTHPFRIIVVESRGSDLLTGGMRLHTDVSSDAIDIARVLEQESITGATVVAWCNGGRVALELAARFPEKVASLVLLSTTKMGVTGIDIPCSVFEETLNVVFHTVEKRPDLAAFLASTLQPGRMPDWESVAHSPVSRAAMLFRLPAKEHLETLYAPVATGESLIHYARRGGSDLIYSIDETLALVKQPILLITGDSDEIVNNQLTVAALRRTLQDFLHVNIQGAGHYINDLQYPYFLWALRHWHADKAMLVSTARAQVKRIKH